MKPGEKISPDSVGLSRLDIATIWEHYDKNKNGLLDHDEVEELADDIGDRIPSLYKQLARIDNPKLSDHALNEMFETDKEHVIPGNRQFLINFLLRELPFNYPQNKKIREHEFTARWNSVASMVFRGLRNDTTGELGCTIL